MNVVLLYEYMISKRKNFACFLLQFPSLCSEDSSWTHAHPRTHNMEEIHSLNLLSICDDGVVHLQVTGKRRLHNLNIECMAGKRGL